WRVYACSQGGLVPREKTRTNVRPREAPPTKVGGPVDERGYRLPHPHLLPWTRRFVQQEDGPALGTDLAWWCIEKDSPSGPLFCSRVFVGDDHGERAPSTTVPDPGPSGGGTGPHQDLRHRRPPGTRPVRDRCGVPPGGLHRDHGPLRVGQVHTDALP